MVEFILNENDDFMTLFNTTIVRKIESAKYLGLDCLIIRDFMDDENNFTQQIFYQDNLLLKENFRNGQSHVVCNAYSAVKIGIFLHLSVLARDLTINYQFQEDQGSLKLIMLDKIRIRSGDRTTDYYSEAYGFKLEKRVFSIGAGGDNEVTTDIEHYYQSGNLQSIIDYIEEITYYFNDEASSQPVHQEYIGQEEEDEEEDQGIQVNIENILRLDVDFEDFDICSICLADKQNLNLNQRNPIALVCNKKHIFCEECLENHINFQLNQGKSPTCPLCRTVIQMIQV